MEDGVRKVFMALIKVPLYIGIMYMIMNIIFFALFYMRALGISYTVMQTAVENNYIPKGVAKEINKSLNSLSSASDSQESSDSVSSPVATNFMIFIDTSGNRSDNQLYSASSTLNEGSFVSNGSVNKRVQYGREIRVGVGYLYKVILPLVNGTDTMSYAQNKATNVVRITYKVPGLKYYPDL